MKADITQAINALKSGQKPLARQLLVEIVKNHPRNAQAWYTLSFVVDDKEHQLDCLRRALKYMPEQPRIRSRLQALEATCLPSENPFITAQKTSIAKTDFSEHGSGKLPSPNAEHLDEVDSQIPLPPPAIEKQLCCGNSDTEIRQRNLWWVDFTNDSEQFDDPDILEFLIEDVAQLPIITSPHQEFLLGLQLRAAPRLATILRGWKPHVGTTSYAQFLCQELLVVWGELDRECSERGVQLPRLEYWASELLMARRNVYGLQRSRLLRFMRRLQTVPGKGVAEKLLAAFHQVVETLAIFPGEALTKWIGFVNVHHCLPSLSEMADWLPPTPDTLQERTAIWVKQTQHTLTTGYLRYAMRVAQGYLGQGVDYADLVQAGFVGLSRAAGKFDYRVQARFGTYATSWIWQAVGREIADQGRTIRLPVHIQESLRKWRVACDLYDDGLEDPTLDPLVLFHAGLLEQTDYDQVQKMRRKNSVLPASVAARYEEAISKACKLRASDVQVFSLSEIGLRLIAFDQASDGIDPVEELVPDEGISLDDVVDTPFVRQLIEDHIFAFLTDREREVLTLRCGWQDGQERTLEEVGSHYGLTRERIRQIEAKAHKKLENRLVLGLLPDFKEMIPKEKDPSPLWQANTQFVFPLFEPVGDKDLTEVNRLNDLLSQLPRSDWIQGRSGVQGGKRQEQLIAALEQLAAPAHVSDIAEQLNSATEGKELEDAHIYALMLRDEETFILLGQSIFSLVKWEQGRKKELLPVLSCCPIPLPDPPDYEDAFFESVLVGQKALTQRLTACQFLKHMLQWAKAESEPAKWFAQAILSAYYLVDLIPYVFFFGGEDPVLRCTLPSATVQELRYHCLKTLTERLVAMPEFWWLLQQNQPVRPSDLGEQFADIHPYGLDDVLQRLRLLASLGAAQKLKYGEYRLTALGEECANWWKREIVVETAAISETNLLHDFAGFIEW